MKIILLLANLLNIFFFFYISYNKLSLSPILHYITLFAYNILIATFLKFIYIDDKKVLLKYETEEQFLEKKRLVLKNLNSSLFLFVLAQLSFQSNVPSETVLQKIILHLPIITVSLFYIFMEKSVLKNPYTENSQMSQL